MTTESRIVNHPSYGPRSRNGVIRKIILRETLDFVTLDGLFLEFGVYNGFSITNLARVFPQQKIWGFDCWQGLPDPWEVNGRTLKPGAYSTNGQIPTVPKNVELVSGLFEDTLPDFAQRHQGQPTAFVHVDSDLYSSAKTIFKYMGPSFVPGTVILFDEYYQDAGEKQAFDEFLAETGLYAAQLRSAEEQASFILTDRPQSLSRIDPTWHLETSALCPHPRARS